MGQKPRQKKQNIKRGSVPLTLLLSPRPHFAKGIWKRTFISTAWPTVHTNPSQKRNFSKTLFKPKEFENARFVFLCRPKNILKTELFENDGLTLIIRLPCHRCPQTQIQNDRGFFLGGGWLNSSVAVWTVSIWCVFRVKSPFSNSSYVPFQVLVWFGSLS